MGITEEQYIKGGYGKLNLKREFIDEAHSRTIAPDGHTIVRGEAGRQLLRRKQERQRYYEENK